MIKDRLMEDFKVALRNNNTLEKNTIQLLRAAILQEEKDQQKLLLDLEVETILFKENKKRLDALAQFEKAQRKDLIEQTNKELLIIKRYLPEPMSEYELKQIIKTKIEENKATKKDKGKIIRLTKQEAGNRADGRTISILVTEMLPDN